MKNNITTIISLILLTCIILMFQSCEEGEQVIPFQEPISTTLTSFEDESLGAPIRMGKKLVNPYGLQKMQEALILLTEKNQKSGKKYNEPIFSDPGELETTEFYVKFITKNLEDIERLEEDSLFLSEVPLDYEIKEEGDYFQHPEAETREEKWLYSVVPKGYTFPTNIRYEIIAELFLTEPAYILNEEDDFATTRNILGKNISIEFLDDLEDEALRLTGNYTEPEVDSSDKVELEKRRRKKRPKGTIKVKNTFTGAYDPVPRIRIRTRRWFKIGKAWTNSNGFYSINRRYRRKCRYKIKFRSNRGFRIWSNIVSIRVARHRAGKHSPRGRNVNYPSSHKGWRWATVNNASLQYLQYCSAFRIGKPYRKIRIVAKDGNRKSRSSAPMLRKMRRLPASGIYSFLKAFNYVIPVRVLWRVIRFVAPDVIIITRSRNTQKVFSETFHELAHASHFERAGSRYWEKFAGQIISNNTLKNDPYGDGRAKNDGYIDIGEMWGNYVSARFSAKKYGGSPFYPSVGIRGWIQSRKMGELENEAMYSMREIYSALKTHVNSRCDLRDELVRQYGKNIIKVDQILCPQNNTLR